MKAVTWQGRYDVEVQEVPDPILLNPRDAIVRVTSTAICGSDLHLYDGYIPSMQKGDILGHEFMGEVVQVGDEVHNIKLDDRVIVPFVICQENVVPLLPVASAVLPAESGQTCKGDGVTTGGEAWHCAIAAGALRPTASIVSTRRNSRFIVIVLFQSTQTQRTAMPTAQTTTKCKNVWANRNRAYGERK
jgi:NADPH:quinone reductase-like Zn-dependent oxidoreductase